MLTSLGSGVIWRVYRDPGYSNQDIAYVIHYEHLTGVWLVGHSYGGAVITGVAERVPECTAELVYLDGYVLYHG